MEERPEVKEQIFAMSRRDMEFYILVLAPKIDISKNFLVFAA